MMANTDLDISVVAWMPAETPPPRPEMPYKAYLVWAKAADGPITSGVCLVVRWDRDAERWEPEGLFRPAWGDHLVVTNWAVPPRPNVAGPGRDFA